MGGARRGKRHPGRSERSLKGRLVEQIVEAMHTASGATVRRNVKLPAVGGSGKREIDVLIEASVSGYPVRIAVECKNLGVKVEPELIDAFVGKLLAVGIPVQHGIYVAVNGYTQGAIDRAAAAGIRTLVLTGLTPERLAAAISEAYQSVIYLLASVESLSVVNDVESVAMSGETIVFYDDSGVICATVPDMLWQMWGDGRIPRDLGVHHVELTLDPSWHSVVDGKRSQPHSVAADVRVVGLVVTVTGESRLHQLVDASNQSPHKTRIELAFPPIQGELPVLTVQSDGELELAIDHGASVSVSVGRIPLPRIVLFRMYWPPSERLAETMEGLVAAYLAGEGPDPSKLGLGDIEGTSLNSQWDPIWQGHRRYRNDRGGGTS